jgi:hypothetical protein
MAEQQGDTAAGMDLDVQTQATVAEGNAGEDSAMTAVETAVVASSDGASEISGSEPAPAQESSDVVTESKPASLDDQSGNLSLFFCPIMHREDMSWMVSSFARTSNRDGTQSGHLVSLAKRMSCFWFAP